MWSRWQCGPFGDPCLAIPTSVYFRLSLVMQKILPFEPHMGVLYKYSTKSTRTVLANSQMYIAVIGSCAHPIRLWCQFNGHPSVDGYQIAMFPKPIK